MMRAHLKTLISSHASLIAARPWYPWALAGLVLVIAWYVSDSNKVWFTWLCRLLVCHTLALAIVSQLNPAFGLFGKVVGAVLAASFSAYVTEFGISLLLTPDYPARFGGIGDPLIAAAFSSVLLLSSIMREESARQAKVERQLVESKLHALQAQIEPHFLYNTLGNVQQLVRTAPADADKMLQHLITYLKATIPDVRNGRGLLGQEIDRARSYLQIMQFRVGSRLGFEIYVAEDLRNVAIPPLGVLTLVENAVKHGVDKIPEGGVVSILAKRADNKLIVKVVDNGVGFGDNMGSGTGLENLRQRLATLYGTRASLELTHREPRGVEATLQVPIESITEDQSRG